MSTVKVVVGSTVTAADFGVFREVRAKMFPDFVATAKVFGEIQELEKVEFC